MANLEDKDPHAAIDATNVVERYVLQKLDEQEQSLFEDHFVDCPRCLEAVELAQELRDGLDEGLRQREINDQGSSESSSAHGPLPFPTPNPLRSPAVWQLAAALVLVSLLPSIWLAQRNHVLQDQVERLQQPWVATPDAVLEIQRGPAPSTTAPSNISVITPMASAAWITLAVELGDPNAPLAATDSGATDSGATDSGATVTVDAVLTGPDEQPLWTQIGLPAPTDGRLILSFPRRLVPAGRYQLALSLREGDRTEPVGAYRFEITHAETELGPSAE